MKIPEKNRHFVKKVAQHEAGHYVVSRALGFKAGAISLKMTDYQGGHIASSAITLAIPIRSIDESIKYLENRIQILFAGALAEALEGDAINNDHAHESLKSGGGARDYNKIQELINLLRNLKSPNADGEGEPQASLTAIDNDLYDRAVKAVERDNDVINKLAKMITSKVQYVHQPVAISETELLEFPALITRFGDSPSAAAEV